MSININVFWYLLELLQNLVTHYFKKKLYWTHYVTYCIYGNCNFIHISMMVISPFRSSPLSASLYGPSTSDISTTQLTEAPGWRVPSTTSKSLLPWLWPPSLRVCPLSSPRVWLWAPAVWPRRTPLFVPCPPWRPWAVPRSSALTRLAHSQPTRCRSARWVNRHCLYCFLMTDILHNNILLLIKFTEAIYSPYFCVWSISNVRIIVNVYLCLTVNYCMML